MSNDSHVIRLRGPWNFEIVAADGNRLTGIFDFAGDWWEIPAAHKGGALLLRRRFGRPGHLDADERVWLVVAGAGLAPSKLSFNDRELTTAADDLAAFRADITDLLRARNELAIRIDRPADGSSMMPLLDDVRLEIDFA